MASIRVSRRRLLTVAGAGLAVGALTGCGLAVKSADPPTIDLPEMNLGVANMSNKILVAYASQAGSTAGVAEAIGRTLAERGASVDVRPVGDVEDVSPYRAVVAGSAIHGGKWLPEAMQFMEVHQDALRQKPFAAFLACITLSMANAEKYRPGVSDWMQPVRALVRPVSEGLFAGSLDFGKLPLSANTLLLRLPVMFGAWTTGDHRDWNAIRAWASSLEPLLLDGAHG